MPETPWVLSTPLEYHEITKTPKRTSNACLENHRRALLSNLSSFPKRYRPTSPTSLRSPPSYHAAGSSISRWPPPMPLHLTCTPPPGCTPEAEALHGNRFENASSSVVVERQDGWPLGSFGKDCASFCGCWRTGGQPLE